MMKGLKRLAGGGLLLLEMRGIRKELEGLKTEVGRIASALELANAHHWPQTTQPDPGVPAIDITYIDDQTQAEFMDIELRLTAARGAPPTEEEILREFELRRQDQGTEGTRQ